MRLILTLLAIAVTLTSCTHTNSGEKHYSAPEIRAKAVGTWTFDAWYAGGGPSMITVIFGADGSFQSTSKELAWNFFDPFDQDQTKAGREWIHKGAWRAKDGYIDISKNGEPPDTGCGGLLVKSITKDEMVCGREEQASPITFRRKPNASTPKR